VLLPSALPVQAATPAFRQSRGVEIGSGTVASVALTSANVAGNLIVVQVIWSNTGAVTMSDTRGNAYVAATPRTTWASGWSAQSFYAKNIAAGADTVRATFATSINSFGIVQVHEYTGIDKANPLDGATIRTGTGTTMNSGPVTTTNANDLLWAAGASAGTMNAAPSGWTQRLNTSGNRTMDRIVTSAGTYTVTPNHSGGSWVMQLVAFKADAGLDTTAPSTPGNVSTSAVSSGRIDVGWSASTDDVGVTGYEVERCQTASCTNFAPVTTVTGTGYSDAGLQPGTLYRYRVRARDAAGNVSAYSAVAQATTQGVPDTTAPSVPTGVSGAGLSISSVSLSWTPSTDDVGVTGYKVFRNGAQVGTSTTASFVNGGLAVNTSYTYTVSAHDAAGNDSAQSQGFTVSTLPDTTAPSTPTNLAAQAVAADQIRVSWTASTDDVGVSTYRIYRDGAFLTTSSVTPWNDAGLTPGTTYSYRVSAADAAGNESDQTAPAVATTPTLDTQPPSASMTAPSPGSTVSGLVTVSATATDNVGVAEVDFLVDGVSVGVDTTAPYSVSWNSTTTSNGPHNLSARARDVSGNFGVTSGVVSVTVSNPTTPPLPPNLVAGWNFDEGQGTTTADVSGNGNTATFQRNPAWAPGKYGSGIRLDGVDDFLSVLNSPTLNVSGAALTVSMWVNPLGGQTDQVLVGKFWNAGMTDPFYQHAIELRNNGTTPVFLLGTSAGLRTAAMGSALPLGQWSHLAITFDGSTVRFFRNGTLVSSPSLVVSTITPRDTLLYLGADVSPGQYFNGTLDDVRLYNRTLTQGEVETDMNLPLAAGSSDPSAPTVSITNPLNNAQVSGSVTITADAHDDVGVAGVQFFVDGSAIGPEDVAIPYAATWDTRTYTNGAHTVTARARDTSGNIRVATPVNANVVNADFFQNQVLATGFDLPTAMKFLPDGRMLVAELRGKIKLLPPPYLTPDPTPFLQISNLGQLNVIQQGIFDLALDPNYATNHHYYVFYTANNGNGDHDRLSRFTANAASTGTIPGSELVLYEDPGAANHEHHGGGIAFSNDGKILFTTGEHFAGTPSQDLTSPRGKIHRINPDGSVPTDNPFYDGAGPNWDSVWALGLRNPLRAYYDSPTGRLFVGDVGGNVDSSNEEVNLGVRGANYGWPNSEGPCGSPCTSPLYDYEHNGRDASITGGFVYRGSQFPASMQGSYFFGDYAQNWIKRLTLDANGNVTGVFNFEPANGQPDGPTGDIVYLTEGPDGSLFYLDLGYSDVTGSFGVSKVRRIRYLQSNQAPIAVAAANPTSGVVPLVVSFSSSGSRDPDGGPVTFSWDFGDGSPLSTQANPVHTYTTAGEYTVRLTVSDGSSSTFSTPITIQAGGLPTASITAPFDGATFRAGDVISLSGAGADPEDGPLPASAFTWNIDFLHDGHVHPGQVITGSKTGTFTIPTTGHDFEGNTRYRISLTVTDSSGLTSSAVAVIWPQKVNLTFGTAPTSGLTLFLDGIARTTPFTIGTLIGFNHTIEARNQTLGGSAYTFASWSDGGGQTHVIVAPVTPASYTATYAVTPTAPTGLAGAWGFNAGAGTSAVDSSGNGNTATLLNGLAWGTGKYGSGLSLDGVNDYLSVPNSASLNVSGSALSLSMWVNPNTASTGDHVLLGKHWNATMTSPYYQYGIELQGNSTRPVLLVGTAAGYVAASMTGTLTKGVWSHLAIVWNGSTAQFYVNGVLVNSATLSATITARSNPLQIGADADPGQFYRGLLDDVRIYNRAQTAAEVVADMNTGL
jgi:glucose/arabinose dehydrogenase/PKD repeat protein